MKDGSAGGGGLALKAQMRAWAPGGFGIAAWAPLKAVT